MHQPLLGGASALSYLVGTAFAILPAGLGVREGVRVRVLAQALMELEVTRHVGAERHERTPERTGQRNGYREREWDEAEPELRSGYGEWSRRSGHRATGEADNDDAWERLRDAVRTAWEQSRGVDREE